MQRLGRIEKTRGHACAVEGTRQLLRDVRGFSDARKNQLPAAGAHRLDLARRRDKFIPEVLGRRFERIHFDADARPRSRDHGFGFESHLGFESKMRLPKL